MVFRQIADDFPHLKRTISANSTMRWTPRIVYAVFCHLPGIPNAWICRDIIMCLQPLPTVICVNCAVVINGCHRVSATSSWLACYYHDFFQLVLAATSNCILLRIFNRSWKSGPAVCAPISVQKQLSRTTFRHFQLLMVRTTSIGPNFC